MPVIEITALPPARPIDRSVLLADINRAVADVLSLPIGTICSVWNEVPAGAYVEGERPADAQPTATHPPIVRVTAFEGRRNEVVVAALEAIVRVLGDALCDGEPNVYATWVEARSGRVHTGGMIRFVDPSDVTTPPDA